MNTTKSAPLKTSALVLGAAVVAMSGLLAAPAHAKKSHIYVYIGVPAGVGIGLYDGPSCYWLKKKAINTGSAYWWNKYQKCKYG